MFTMAGWQREYIVAQDARLAALSREQSRDAWDYKTGSTEEWSLCWSNSVSHPIEVLHCQGSRITEHWILGGGIVTNIWQEIPASQYPWSSWGAVELVHPNPPFTSWLMVQWRTNLVNGLRETKTVLIGN